MNQQFLVSEVFVLVQLPDFSFSDTFRNICK